MADNLQPTPRNQLLGLLSDAMYGGLDWMKDPRRSQQMQGLAGLLESTGIPKTTERMAYGEPLTNIGRANVPLLKPETAEAMMTVAPLAPAVGKAGKGIARMAGEEINAAMMGERGGFLGAMTPQPMRIIDMKKGIYNPELTMEEMLKVKDIPTVDRVKQSIDLVGEKEFEKMVNAQFKKYKPTNPETEAMLVESVTLDILGRSQRKSPYPQQAALDLAQQRAALPVEQGGLGLLANNTAADRAKAMGFDTNVLHGSPNPNIKQFDPMMAGVNTNNAFDNNIFATTSPESATGYALNWEHYRNQIKTSPEYKAINREENALLKDLLAYKESGNDKGVSDVNAKMDLLSKQRENIYNNFLAGKLGSQGSTIYPLIVRSKDFLPYEASGAGWMRANRPAIDAAEQAGYSGALIKNVKDNAGANLGSIADVYATPDPTRFRSRFAAFDPFRKDVATATAMGVALPDLLAAEPTPEELQRRQSSSLLFP